VLVIIMSIQETGKWCAFVSDAIRFIYGIFIPQQRLWNASLTGELSRADVNEALRWAQAVTEWKTDQSDQAVWPGHIGSALWPLFWEVALRVDQERTFTAVGYALTALAYREYHPENEQKVCG